MPPADVRTVQRSVLRWYAANARSFPWRSTRDPYRVLVAEVMLQQTQTSRVGPAYETFLARFPSVRELAEAPVGEAIRAWHGLGYNRRAVALHRASHAIGTGGFPRDVEGLRGLPGVGSYTAAAIACFAFDVQVPVIDTNVRRVLGRAAHGRDAVDVSRVALDWLPLGNAYEWNQALMDIGATICKPATPKCGDCPLSKGCVYRRTGGGVRSTKKQPPFEGSTRQRRGAIVARLRQVDAIKVGSLSEAERASLKSLEKDGLIEVRRGVVRLP